MEEFNSVDILKKQNEKKRLTFLEIVLFEISFVLIIVIVVFGALNYFNILSLSTLYPNQLSWLPHQQTIKKQTQKYPLTPTSTNSVLIVSKSAPPKAAKNSAKPISPTNSLTQVPAKLIITPLISILVAFVLLIFYVSENKKHKKSGE
jgi:predicted PurR-regulated permease PerM